MKNWDEIATTSEHHAVLEIKKSFEEGNYVDVEEGLETLLEVMERAEKRALKSQLVRLMLHIIKWKIQPEKRSRSWVKTINDARDEIADEQEFSPSLNENHIKEIWEKSFKQAKRGAEDETGLSTEHLKTLTWQEVFENAYIISQQ